MPKKLAGRIWAASRRPVFSPGGFLCRAALLAVALLTATVLGFREHASLISGTAAFNTFGARLRVVLGCAYIVFYLAAVVLGPILVIASVILWGFSLRAPTPPSE